MSPKEEIEKLHHGEHWTWPESDYGKAEIWLLNDTLVLFEIPQFGGTPMFIETFSPSQIDKLIATVEKWT